MFKVLSGFLYIGVPIYRVWQYHENNIREKFYLVLKKVRTILGSDLDKSVVTAPISLLNLMLDPLTPEVCRFDTHWEYSTILEAFQILIMWQEI